jgi:hypothetical protein
LRSEQDVADVSRGHCGGRECMLTPRFDYRARKETASYG